MTAIGDSDRLRAALKNEPGVQLYEQYALRYGLRYDVAASEDLSVPAYDESVRMRYAQPR